MTRILPHYFVLLISLMGATISLPMQKRSIGRNGECGRENPNPFHPSSRISGGTGTRPHQYPWMVRLDHCGGSLISDRHVLTAKHCLNIPQKWAKVGVHNRHDASVYQEIPIIDKMWPDYDDHDIAILILAEPVTFTDNIRQICLPAPEEQVYVGNEMKTLGWGMTGLGSEESAELMEADLTLSNSKSKNYIYTGVKIIDGEPVDPCAGDSGGPLMHQDSNTGIWTIFGTLTGGGYNCQDGRTNGDGKWNKVTSHLDWINGILDNRDCGRENQHNFEIFGGILTAPHQYPWMVLLEGCGGSLISDRHVLTAKHCVEGKDQEWVKVGVHNQYDENVQKIKILDAVWPDYNSDDIAIVILEEPVTFSDNIRTICLPASDKKVDPDTQMRHLGWGMTGVGSEQSALLKQADLNVSIVSPHKNVFYTEVNTIQGDPCAGDSGGPLMSWDSVTRKWTIFGTLRGGGYSCNKGKTVSNGEWNKVTPHLDWINEILDQGQGGAPRCPKFTRGQAIGGREKNIGFYNQNDCIKECKKLPEAVTVTIDFTATETTTGACYCGFGERTLDDGTNYHPSRNYNTCFL